MRWKIYNDMNIERKKTSNAKVSNRILCNRLNEAEYRYGTAQANSTAQTMQIMIHPKIYAVVG